ncbi:NAD(P)-binding Rossmann-fold superfamily protein [Artemisia annua]|uniref:NAD(P)-binding Rossmann-fold superfamily protein n=1 Tax=Artemisia annua TaxID=35608 RepID=A0A2U1LFH9_ARTAN|nr:NAD(P)-binding Rossmann-fold superfamily protein [Artemisia annua]
MASPSKKQQQKQPICHPKIMVRWWSKDTVAIVTGANKGIGYALVKRLAELGLSVVLTARDESKGSKAVNSLKELGLERNVCFCQLDISDPVSVRSFVSWFKSRFDGFDILVNNAAVCYNTMGENSIDHAETVINTNYYGSKLFTEAMLPFFHCSASTSRILNISSRLGTLDKLKNAKMKALLGDKETLSEERIDMVVNLFLQDVKEGIWKMQGWPEIWTDYSVSKLALNAYSQVLACKYEGVVSVNCFCPGFTQTSMTDGKGNHSADDAAEMAATIALLPPKALTTGKFYAGSTSRGVFSKL